MALSSNKLPPWVIAVPLLTWVVLVDGSFVTSLGWLIVLMTFALASAVFAAVHHAKVVAHGVGEPFGTLVLTIAVTVIEVALIVLVMLSSGPEKAGLACDTVFAAIMLTCNGIVGVCLFVGDLRHREQAFQAPGATTTLAALAALVTLTMVLPNYTSPMPGPVMTSSQLAFTGVTPLVLHGCSAIVQTIRYHDYFLVDSANEDMRAPSPSVRVTAFSVVLLMVSLVAVVGLVKVLSPPVEAAILNAGAPPVTTDIVIAALVLLPECLAALRVANADRIRASLNLVLGSALVSIGLTIPTVAAVSIWIGRPLELGLGPKEMVLLFLVLIVSSLTLDEGCTTILQGVVHLAIFAAYLSLSTVP